MALNGKSVLVTGAAAGMGYAVAERFLRDGARLVIADSDAERGEDAERSLGRIGTVIFAKADVSSRLDMHNLVALALDAFGDLDVLVNAATRSRPGDFLTLHEDDLDQAIAVNLKGVFLAAQSVARCMADKVDAGGPPGSIINLATLDTTPPAADRIAWAISRSAIADMTRAMAVSLAPQRIRVNAIGYEAAGASRPPETATPQAVGATAAFLASGEAGDLTGAVLRPGFQGE